jgi:hypothetical protein
MKHAFMMTDAGRIESRIVRAHEVPTGFEIGDKFVTGLDIDMKPYGIVPAGTHMEVVSHDHDTGEVNLKFRDAVSELTGWGAVLVIMPFDCEAALSALNEPHQPQVLFIHGDDPRAVA